MRNTRRGARDVRCEMRNMEMRGTAGLDSPFLILDGEVVLRRSLDEGEIKVLIPSRQIAGGQDEQTVQLGGNV